MKILFKILVLFFLIIEIDNCVGYRILGLFPLNVKSHFKMYERLMKGLVERGHQVDVISCFPLDTPIKNYTDIVIDELAAEHIDEFTYDLLPVYNGLNQFKVIATMVGNDVCDGIVKNSKVQDIINNPPKNPPYDLIIMELVAGNCFMALGHKLNIPVIAVSSSFWPWTSAMFGNPENLAVTANLFTNNFDRMNFFDRMYNVIFTFYTNYIFNKLRTPQDEIIKKTFGPSTPGLMELEKQFDLFLLNTHPSLDDPIPRVPGLIEVGGLHALNDDGPELSVADKKWLDESTDGFIYFTFGSFAVTESFPLSTIQAFYKSFAKLAPIRILMKVKQPERLPPGLPDNVKIFTWISQPKVLKHKNIRAFITHGGLMGTQEAVLYGVPMIGVPLFCDQFTNVDLYVRKNIAIRLEHKEITEQKLDFALKEILKNPMYRNNAKKLAIKFRDRPSSPLDTACYWIEYIGRHGKNALRSPTLDLAWWQVQLLDVYAAVLFAITIILIISIDNCVGYRILALFPLNVKSHFKMYERLMKGLVERGHQVDVISCYPLDTPMKNYTDIVLDLIASEDVDEFTYDLLPIYTGLSLYNMLATSVGNDLCKGLLENSKIKNIINNPPTDPPYDLIIMELFAANCFMALGHKLSIPVIATSTSFWPWTSAMLGNPENLAVTPNILIYNFDRMNFFDRMYNVIFTFYTNYIFNKIRTPQDQMIKETFGPNTPSLMELEKTFDLFLVNTHPSLNDPIPRIPALIEVGGLHALDDDSPELTMADKKRLDESTDGFIYFTFGSFAVTESFPLSIIQAFYKSFAKLAPMRVLMRVKRPERLLPGLPENVKIFTWISQPKVLKHGEITEQKLDSVLKEILENPMYRNNAKKLAIKFRDRPSSPLDTACYWIEYIGRHGYRILAVFPLNAKSHFKMYEKLMKGLVKRGHQVDVISSLPLDTPITNYTDIVLDPIVSEHIDEFTYDLLPVYTGLAQYDILATAAGNVLCKGFLEDSKTKNIINNLPTNPPYDLIIMELFAANCFMALGHRLNIPVIAASTSFWPWTSAMIGNPENLAITKNIFLNTNFDRLNFFDRMYNVIFTFYTNYIFNKLRAPQDKMIEKTFGPSTPGLIELEKQFDLFLVNTHPSLNDPIPRVPALIEVGGLHALDDDSPELTEADKKWLDESTDGFIYFTFGSMVVTESFPLSIIEAFYKSFAKLAPLRVLMKVKRPERLPPGLPSNVKIFSWISQPKVLNHENIRAFITHGGLMGTQEAVLYGVPMIGVPLFCDQFDNVDLYVRKNIAIRLDHKEITEQKLNFALNEILENPMYRINAKKLAIKFKDRLSSPLDTACYWIEYIGRHGKNSLRSPTLDLAWWQVQLLDVYAAILFIITMIIIISVMILALFPLNVRSHFKMFARLTKGLVERGHQMDVISCYPLVMPMTNHTDITIRPLVTENLDECHYNFFYVYNNVRQFKTFASQLGNKVCEGILKNSEIQNIINNPSTNPPYDLILMELFAASCFMALGHQLNIPIIAASSSLWSWSSAMLGNSENLAVTSNLFTNNFDKNNFFDRMYNVIFTFYTNYIFNDLRAPQDAMIEEMFGPSTPGLMELEKTFDLFLVNTHPSLDDPIPRVPGLIEVGGLHALADDSPELSVDKKWLDKSTYGFIYLSFGSFTVVESFPLSIIEAFYKSFNKLAPIRILMRVKRPERLSSGLPSNVKTFTWISQAKVLQHKNIRAFITHGGLMGTQEAVANGVPMIGVPLFTDQFTNIDLYVRKNIAIRLDHKEITEQKLDFALREILENPMYRINAKKLAIKFRDRPASPLDTACYWIEYIGRHAKGLARRGHQVDVVSPYPLVTPMKNYTDITVEPLVTENINDFSYNHFYQYNNIMQFEMYATQIGNDVCDSILKNSKIKNIINNPPTNPPYDLFIMELLGGNCFMAFGHKLNIPMIAAASSSVPWTSALIGNPDNLAITNNIFLSTSFDRMKFFDRMYNVIFTFYTNYIFNKLRAPQNKMIEETFGPNIPDLMELEKQFDLLLVNTHPSLNDPVPRVPAFIEVGGLHALTDDTPKLTEADKKWLDESTDGFIYLSFGSMAVTESFPLSIIEAFYKSFAKIAPIRILMKIKQPEKLPPGLPDNIKTFTWISQAKVLKHKNIRAFITHGGLMGTQEAVAHGVPMIGVPLFCDQYTNIDLYVQKNIAIRLEHKEITEQKLDFALREILENPMYRINAKKLAIKFRDRPASPLDTACFWIEYIGRHGKNALRSPTLDLAWWQYD
ncbi:hypothetical protein HCN44_003208 [Aphidius gifuensis]|uniref:Glucuronosyltransferase n=1 Tax=Aphidius gifuensis TaxID=684658 RepID=A0A834XIB0_APHGI|nr:hypothetical protein HCN44_003208 [Aphidius gifuensis]